MVALVSQQVLKLFLFLLIGFVIMKLKLVPEQTPAALSKVVLWVFSPAMALRNLARNLTVETLVSAKQILLVGVCSVLVCAAIAVVTAKLVTKDHYTGNVITYSVTTPNFGYFAYPFALSVFGESQLLMVQLFCIPLTLFTYSFGMSLLLDNRRGIKGMLNAPMVGMLIGAAIGLSGLELPAVADAVLSDLMNCMGPAAMILSGCTIAKFAFKDILGDWRIYVVVAIRMVLIPLGMIGLSRLLCLSQETVLTLMCVNAMPVGINGVVFPASINKDCKFGAGLAVVANIFCLATIPLLMSLVV